MLQYIYYSNAYLRQSVYQLGWGQVVSRRAGRVSPYWVDGLASNGLNYEMTMRGSSYSRFMYQFLLRTVQKIFLVLRK